MSYSPPPPGSPPRPDLPPPPDPARRPGKGSGALLFFFAVIPGVLIAGFVASLVNFRLQIPVAALAAVGALILIRQKLGEQAMIGCLIAFGATAVVAGGACIALLAAFMNSY